MCYHNMLVDTEVLRPRIIWDMSCVKFGLHQMLALSKQREKSNNP